MIISMTGFGLASRKNNDFSIEVNVKSTNNRFFDLNVKMPSLISSLEKTIHDSCKAHFIRGSIKLYCKIKINEIVSRNNRIDKKKLEDFYNTVIPLEKKFDETNISLNVSIDKVLSQLEIDLQEIDLNEKNRKFILNTFDKAFIDMVKSRKSEGKKIEKEIKFNLSHIKKINSKLIRLESNNKKEHFENYKKRIKILLSQYELELDDSKIYKELAIFSDKYDISEETSRIKYHIDKFQSHIKNEDYPGKKINFLCQELFREINTIGSKSNNKVISSLVVDFKTSLEKIREQIQNIL